MKVMNRPKLPWSSTDEAKQQAATLANETIATAKADAKHQGEKMSRRARKQAERQARKARDQIPTAEQIGKFSEDTRKQLAEALEQTLEKIRDSATLAKLQDEARERLSDAIVVARDHIKDATPVAVAKLDEVKAKIEKDSPKNKKRRSRLRMVMLGMVIVPGVFIVLKKLVFRSKPEEDPFVSYEWAAPDVTEPVMSSAEASSPASSASSTTAAASGSTGDVAPAVQEASAPTNGSTAPTARPSASSSKSPEASQKAVATAEKAETPDDAAAAKLNAVIDKDVTDLDGKSLGKVQAVYYRAGTWQPEWAVVTGGTLSRKTVTVPLVDAAIDDAVMIAYSKELIEAGPDFEGNEVTSDLELKADRHFHVRRESGSDATPDKVVSDMRLRAWPAQPEKLVPDV